MLFFILTVQNLEWYELPMIWNRGQQTLLTLNQLGQENDTKKKNTKKMINQLSKYLIL